MEQTGMNNALSERLSLSLVQQDVFYDQLHSIDSPKYNIGGYVHLNGIDEEKIKQAHTLVLTNNRMFRMRLVNDLDGVFVCLSPDIDTYLQVIDMSAEKDPHISASKWIDTIFSRPFDLYSEKLFFAFLLKISNSEYFYVGIAHHLVIDGWGFANWARQLGDYYSNNTPEVESEAHFLTYYTQDFSYLQSERYLNDKNFWSDYLNNHTTRNFSANRSVKVGESCSQRLCFDVDTGLYNAVLASSDILRRNEHSLFFALVAAYFSRITQRGIINIGVPVHNRKGAENKRFIGLFTSMSPVQIEVQDQWSFVDLVEKIKQEQAKVYRHQKYPIGHMVRDLGPAARAGLFEIGVNYLKLDNKFIYGDTTAKICYVENNYQTTPFNLTVWSNGEAEPLQLQIDFSLQHFNAEEINLIGARLQWLLLQIAQNPDVKIGSLDLISREEKEFIWPAPDVVDVIKEEVPFIQLFEEQVVAQPDKLALSWRTETFSYRQLNQQAAALADKLGHIGIGTGHLVGLLLDRRPEMVIAILALHKLGAAYLPLDPSYPTGRLGFMVEDSKCRLLLTTSHFSELANVLGIDILTVDDCATRTTDRQLHRLFSNAAAPQQLAYVIYTSGSTGKPKGVMVSQRALSNFLQSMKVKPGFGPDDCLLAVTPFSFDISILELLLPLLSGGSVRLFHTALTHDVQGFIQDLDTQSISMLQMTPSAWKILLGAGWKGSPNLTALAGGEALPIHLAGNLVPKVKSLWNMYGPTETTIWSSCSQVRLPMEINSIGKPIANTQMLIMDAHNRPLPMGVFGMLCIGGKGLAEGYLFRPELTEERFTNVLGQRWYQTGDIARLLPNGEFEFQGRADHQIKMNGYRIELGEIEGVLSRQSNIIDNAVLIKTLAGGRQTLCAYYQCHGDINELELKAALAVDLPSYMLPSVYIRVDKFPRTPSGKTDLNALPEPEFNVDEESVQISQNHDELTLTLLGMVKAHLHISRLTPGDNFFDVGASSIDVMDMATRLNRELGLTLSVIDMFAHPSIQALVKFIQGKSSEQSLLHKMKRQEAAQAGKSRLNNRLNARKLLDEV